MSIERQVALQGNEPTVTINVSEYFDYQTVRDFQNTYLSQSEEQADYIVDLRQTKYIDSCALGMLLNLDKTVRRRSRNMKIVNCNEHVRKIFTIVNFDKKLSIR